ncbi:putative transporter -like protein [Trichinella nelsoni]|uniref:Putative transporter-like protein n=1 Tax=Trichinella nelsoni TaxID=6336 RepID=A0A0V0RQP9_9BILA|nr:putative transporter -like protein [Trichinella nelsoni]
MAFLLCLAITNITLTRNSLSVAMVCMVNSTAFSEKSRIFDAANESLINQSVHIKSLREKCPIDQLAEESYQGGEFAWTSSKRDIMFSAIYWGALVSGLPSGMIADRYSPKRVIFVCLIGTVLSTMLIPIGARYGDFMAVFALRFISGVFGQATVVPAIGSLISNWVPSVEKSSAIAIYTAGNQIANIIGMPLNAFLCEQKGFFGGWPSIFYVCGFIGIAISAVWCVVVTDTPDSNRFISAAEKSLIIHSIRSQSASSKKKRPLRQLPWKKLLFSAPMISCNTSNFMNSLMTTALATYIPIYFKDALHMDLKRNGLLSALPYIAQLVIKFIFAYIADQLKARYPHEQTNIAKFFNSIGTFASGSFLIALSFVDCTQPVQAIVCMVLANGLLSGGIAGFQTSTLSIAPAYSGTVSSLSKYLGQVASVITPYLIGSTISSGDASEWHFVFFGIGSGLVAAGFIFLFYGSSEIQEWALVIPDVGKPTESGPVRPNQSNTFRTVLEQFFNFSARWFVYATKYFSFQASNSNSSNEEVSYKIPSVRLLTDFNFGFSHKKCLIVFAFSEINQRKHCRKVNTSASSASGNYNFTAKQSYCPICPKRNCENLMCKYKPKHLNEFICSLCMGYMIEATTVVECMHHFCRSCILLHIEKDAHCPSCGILINKFKLESALKLDHTLQLLIYKLIPTVYKEEILRRARFQVMNESPEEREKEFSNDYIRDLATHICSPYERVMFILEMKRPPRASITHREGVLIQQPPASSFSEFSGSSLKRLYSAPAAVRIKQLRKMIASKFTVHYQQVTLWYADEILIDEYSLVDVFYIFLSAKKQIIHFYYDIIGFEDQIQVMPELTPEKQILDECSLART